MALQAIEIQRKARVRSRLGYKSDTSLAMQVREGLLTRPVPCGERLVGWPNFEIDEILMARIAGKSKDEIRALVNRLHTKRVELGALLLKGAGA